MIERHPHVFGSANIETAAAQTVAWEVQKAKEREADAAAAGRPLSVLDGVAAGLPALTRAEKLQKRAARIGFDWPETAPVIEKVEEEIAELRAELTGQRDAERLDEEMGDLLFACANLARHLGVEPEGALRRANAKFERRFKRMEAFAAAEVGSGAGQVAMPRSLDRLEALWQRVKAEEAKSAPR
jgi:MazG family protein